MPGIDYSALHVLVSMEDILRLAGFKSCEASGDQVRGPCPIHGSSSPASRSFSANLRKHTFRCFKCGASGNQLDLWVAISKLPLHDAAAICASGWESMFQKFVDGKLSAKGSTGSSSLLCLAPPATNTCWKNT